MFVVFSTSLRADSRSRIMARYAYDLLVDKHGHNESQLFDLSEINLPACDAGECYSDPNVAMLANAVEQAKGILVASPIYNYDFGSSAKNLIELTGKAWTEKIVGFMCAAGGSGSYMAPMGLANSLMLDFYSVILPRFVYATEDMFQDDQITNPDIEKRLEQLVSQLITFAQAIQK